MSLGVGDRIPTFELVDQNGDRQSSASLRGRCLVLFFYPKDETPGCTLQACSFRDSHSELLELGALVWGVSGDDTISHRRFAYRHSLPFPLLSDPGNTLRQRFGVPRTMGLFPGRVTYVIDGDGVIRHRFDNLLDGPAHVREAHSILSGLAGSRA